jgi:hypothetical protein
LKRVFGKEGGFTVLSALWPGGTLLNFVEEERNVFERPGAEELEIGWSPAVKSRGRGCCLHALGA